MLHRSVEVRDPKKPYVFYEGPPTANGKPGIHHVMSRTLKDLTCRYKTMKGFQVKRKAGWDTHGLPVEIEVEKQLSLREISAVPIALPMIAGPATITAAVTFPADYGHISTIIAIVLSLGINLIFMIYAAQIGKFLERFNLLNPLVRIFGLIVATIGTQMVLNGLRGFIG